MLYDPNAVNPDEEDEKWPTETYSKKSKSRVSHSFTPQRPDESLEQQY